MLQAGGTDTGSVAYQTSGALIVIILFLVGLGLLMTGFRNRREDGPADGIVKMTIGGILLALSAASLLTQVIP